MKTHYIHLEILCDSQTVLHTTVLLTVLLTV